MTTSENAAAAELAGAIAELSTSVALPSSDVVALIEASLIATYRRVVGEDTTLKASVDLSNGVWSLTRNDADGEVVEIPLQGDLARQSAQAVRGAVGVRLRELAKDEVMHEAEARRGELLDGIVENRQGSVWLLRIGHHFGLLPPEEQMAGEVLELHQHLKVVVVDARRRNQDAVLIVSRSHPQLLHLLLEQEVPEILTGQVLIKGIVREPGRRSKVAVAAPRGDVDPRGACIGPRGVRHRAITSQLGQEQVQVVSWSEDDAQYIGQALAPATVVGVELDTETRTAHVTVTADQLSLAIGKGGENARLVARLTGWRIDISQAESTATDGPPAGDAPA